MEQIQMGRQLRNANASRHHKTAFKQRPVECFAVEGNQYGALGDPRRHLEQNGMFLGEIPHQELFGLESAGLPPGKADEKCVRSCSAGNSRGFRVEEKPALRILHTAEFLEAAPSSRSRPYRAG